MLNEQKITSHGDGRCNRCLDWLEINVTKWNRHKSVYELQERYAFAPLYIVMFIMYFVIGVILYDTWFLKSNPVIIINGIKLAVIILLGWFFMLIYLILFYKLRIVTSSDHNLTPETSAV